MPMSARLNGISNIPSWPLTPPCLRFQLSPANFPPMQTTNLSTDQLAGISLAEASAKIRSGEVTPTQLTEACLARIDIYDSKLTTFITVMRSQALAQAKLLDAEQRAGKLRGPLHGIPIALKD